MADASALPPGFVLDGPSTAAAAPALPEGFVLDQPGAASAAPAAAAPPSTEPTNPIVAAAMRGSPVTAALKNVPLIGAILQGADAVTGGRASAGLANLPGKLASQAASLAAIPGDTFNGKTNYIQFDPMTGAPQPFNDQTLRNAFNLAGATLGGDMPAMAEKPVVMAGDMAVPDKVLTALKRDGVPVDQVSSKVSDLGPAGAVADIGPNMQGLTGALATTPGSASTTILKGLRDRQVASGERVPAAINDTLGPAKTPMDMHEAIRGNMHEISPEYTDALSGASPVDVAELAKSLDEALPQMRGPAQAAMKQVRAMLNDTGVAEPVPPDGAPTHMSAQDFVKLLTNAGGDVSKIDLTGAEAPKLISDPETLKNVRGAIDTLISQAPPTGDVQRVLKGARSQVDAILADAVPGIKNVDAKYREQARQSDAINTGQTLFDSGRDVPRPTDVAKMAVAGAQPEGTFIGPSATTFQLSQGARAEIDRIIGTNINDRAAMASLIKGGGDYNRARLTSLFGADRANRLFKVMDNEAQMAETERGAFQGSKTSASQAAQKDLEGPSIEQSTARAATSLHPGKLVYTVGRKIAEKAGGPAREAQRQAMADVIMGRGNFTTRTPVHPGGYRPVPVVGKQPNSHEDEVKAAVMRRRQ